MKKIILMTMVASGLAISSFAHADTRSATCDAGWNLVVQKGTDKCVSYNMWGWQKGRFTIPSGTVSFGIDPKVHGWRLITDHKDKRDYWIK